jgi:hypothetical protein
MNNTTRVILPPDEDILNDTGKEQVNTIRSRYEYLSYATRTMGFHKLITSTIRTLFEY